VNTKATVFPDVALCSVKEGWQMEEEIKWCPYSANHNPMHILKNFQLMFLEI